MITNDVSKLSFSDEEVRVLFGHLDAIETMFKDKTIELTKDEGKKFGKLGKGKEQWALEMFRDVLNTPSLLPTQLNLEDWKEEEKTRELLNTVSSRFKILSQQVIDTNRMVGFNIYKKCQLIYENARMLSSKNFKGFKVHFEKWSVFFAKKNKKATPNDVVVNG